MTISKSKSFESRMPAILLQGSGALLLTLALIYNEFLLALIRNSSFGQVQVDQIRLTQLLFVALAVALLILAEGFKRLPLLSRLAKKPVTTNIVLVFLSGFMFFSILELCLRPFVIKSTNIFMKDEALGWKLRPGVDDVWGQVQVKINGKGLVGPELAYTKQPGLHRILFLGDSVTFGFGLEKYEHSFPHLTAKLLEREFGQPVEGINSGVGGYSPWQEYIYLAEEGAKYEPDLVVVSFVLNDVSEKMGLIQYGGTGEGFQLLNTASTVMEQILYKSALVNFSRQIYYVLKFQKDLQHGAQEEESLAVESLARYPNRPEVDEVWEITLANLDKIFDFCAAREIATLLVVFPFTFQFSDIETLSSPQAKLIKYAQDRNLPVLDLLPLLSAKMTRDGLVPTDLFLDADHPNHDGNKVISELIATAIREHDLLRHQNNAKPSTG